VDLLLLAILCTHKQTASNPLTPSDLQRRRAVSPLKIKIPSKKITAGSVAEGFNSGVNGLTTIFLFRGLASEDRRNDPREIPDFTPRNFFRS
jgi:hypothetical protein